LQNQREQIFLAVSERAVDRLDLYRWNGGFPCRQSNTLELPVITPAGEGYLVDTWHPNGAGGRETAFQRLRFSPQGKLMERRETLPQSGFPPSGACFAPNSAHSSPPN